MSNKKVKQLIGELTYNQSADPPPSVPSREHPQQDGGERPIVKINFCLHNALADGTIVEDDQPMISLFVEFKGQTGPNETVDFAKQIGRFISQLSNVRKIDVQDG